MHEYLDSVIKLPDVLNVIITFVMSTMDLHVTNIVIVFGIDVVGVNIATVSLMGLIIDRISIVTVSQRISSCNGMLSNNVCTSVARHK